MGCLRLFSSGSNTDYSDVNPNPKNFKIVKSFIAHGFPVTFINYPQCTNYEGNKILIWDKDITLEKIEKFTELDPHFTGDSSILLRVKPIVGWEQLVFDITRGMGRLIK